MITQTHHLLLSVIWESKVPFLMSQSTWCWTHPIGLSWTFHFVHPLSVSYQDAQLRILEHIWYFAGSSRSLHPSGSPLYKRTAAGTCCSLGSLLSKLSLKEKADGIKKSLYNKPQVYESPVLPICFTWMPDRKLFMLEEMLSFKKHGRILISMGLLTASTPEQYFSL